MTNGSMYLKYRVNGPTNVQYSIGTIKIILVIVCKYCQHREIFVFTHHAYHRSTFLRNMSLVLYIMLKCLLV